MTLTIHRDIEQGSPEWFAVRRGLPTASEFKTIIGIKKDAREKVTRRKYLMTLAGEILTGECAEGYQNAHMERGKAMEAEARHLYAFLHNCEPEQVGFVTNGPKGASPDSLLGDRGLLEIKTKLPHLLIEALVKDEFPAEHKAQCQGALWVAEREWIDIAVYWPKLPLFVRRAYRDDAYIGQLEQAVCDFNAELAEMVAFVQSYSGKREAA